MSWRVGGKVPLNVYEADKLMFQCHTPEDAARVVALLNGAEAARAATIYELKQLVTYFGVISSASIPLYQVVGAIQNLIASQEAR